MEQPIECTGGGASYTTSEGLLHKPSRAMSEFRQKYRFSVSFHKAYTITSVRLSRLRPGDGGQCVELGGLSAELRG